MRLMFFIRATVSTSKHADCNDDKLSFTVNDIIDQHHNSLYIPADLN